MNTLYPDATPEELAAADNVCIICREEMTTGMLMFNNSESCDLVTLFLKKLRDCYKLYKCSSLFGIPDRVYFVMCHKRQ